MKSIIRILKNIIFTLIALLIVYGIIGNIACVSDAVYNIVNYSNYVVLTGSMEPEISPGDYITIKKVNKDELKVGDIITFHMGTDIVTHKIEEINGEEIITKGTANNVIDEPISKKDVIGKYIFRLPKLGYVMSYFSTLSGLILIVGIVCILIFWELSAPNMKEKNNRFADEEYEEFLEYKRRKSKEA